MKTKAKTQFRLASGPMVHTPGMVAWGINGFHFKKDQKYLLNVFVSGWGGEPGSPSPAQFKALLSGKVPFTVEGDTVVFEA